ncbi:MAG TPA: tripartite tricarboxylate transporter TctB family protein [Burkholderiales bacterium]|jgi:hypothetical protein|nr:tripartite tricarboxylate transporter TctB family protein [Burkholderiales bacterium]
MRITAPKDFWAGVMFVAIGVGFAWVAQNYPMGTAVRMGPAYFPTILGVLLAILGLMLVFRGFVLTGDAVPTFHFRPLIVMIVSLILFGVMLRPVGLIASILTLVVISMLAGGRPQIKAILPLSVFLAVFSVLVFHYGLGLPFKLWPWE